VNREELDDRFVHYVPNEDAISCHEAVRAAGRALALKVEHLCPDSREKSLAMTKVEEAVMWANAAIARNPQ